MAKVLVMGASGFLGSHVVKELVAAGRDVRIMVRATSDTRAIGHLCLERVVGGPTDAEAVSTPPESRQRMILSTGGSAHRIM